MSDNHTHKYIGNGAFYPGLPALDLNEANLTPEQKALLKTGVEHGMYEVVAHAPKKPKAAPADDPAEILSEDSSVS